MKNYCYPLIFSGTAAIFLAVAPSQAADSLISEEQSEFNLDGQELTLEQPSVQWSGDPFPESQGENDTDLNGKLDKSISEIKIGLAFPNPQSTIQNPKWYKTDNPTPSLLAQTPPPGSPQPVMVPQPEIIIRSNGTSTPEILQPNIPAAPVLPRAVAPPVGDMAISNIDASFDQIDLGSPAIVPRLVLRQAPAREVLAVLARWAGMNVVFLDESGSQGEGQQAGKESNQPPPGGPPISLDLENESVQEVFNSVLMVSGLRANRRGRTIFVGSKLPTAARNLISRTIRLNQAIADSAATILATQGAEVNLYYDAAVDITVQDTGLVTQTKAPPTLVPLTVQETANSSLLLKGLNVAVDNRLNAITLIGEPRVVQVATSILTQLDARRRQVAINVKIIDVNLFNLQDFNSSFSFGFNDGFFLQDNGTAILNFGGNNPPNAAQTTQSVFAPPVVPLGSTIALPQGGTPPTLTPFLDVQNQAPFGDISRYLQYPTDFLGPGVVPYSRPNFGTFNNPFQPGLSEVQVNPTTGQTELTYQVPELFRYPNKFLLTLQTEIQSGNAKILTDPTLVVQEGQIASVKLIQRVVESVNTQIDALSGVRTVTPVLADAGLTLDVNLDKIDDNGFVSLTVKPKISAPGSQQEFDSGAGAVNTITLLNTRELSSGLIRLRDGQTLILSGIIQETDRTTTSKVPILGDIPILGALFRGQSNTSDRTEVIILLTPKIIEDTPNSALGYNYTPGSDAAEMLQRQGFPVPVGP